MAGRTLRTSKLTSFYGSELARPYVVLKDNGEVEKERVDAPKINDALIEWAQKVPFEQGGALVKPPAPGDAGWDHIEAARTDFQIFFQEKAGEILATNPLVDRADRKTLLAVASLHWRDELTAEQRREYKERAKEERERVGAQLKEAEASNPAFKKFREKVQKYKRSVGSILSAAKAQGGPLWKLQRRMNRYNKMQGGEKEADEEMEQEEEEAKAPAKRSGASKAKGAASKGGVRKSQQQRRRRGKEEQEAASESESDSDSEGEGSESEGAAEALAGLQLKSTKKAPGKKAAPAKAAPSKNKAAPTRTARSKGAGAGRQAYEEFQGEQQQEEEEQREEEGQRKAAPKQHRGKKDASPPAGRGGAAAVARRNTRHSGGQLYEGEYELPSQPASQHPSPAASKPGGRPRGSAKKPAAAAAPKPGSGAAAAAAAALPSAKAGTPGKRTRRGGAASEPAGDVEMTVLSPAKRVRSSARR